MYDFLLTLKQKSPHGGPFQYRSCETDVLGWICEAASGVRMPELMSELLWSKLGAENDATIGVDSVGTGMFDGGINACLRDLARFGSLFLNGGDIADRPAGGVRCRGSPTRSPVTSTRGRRLPQAPTTTACPAGCTETSAGSRVRATTCCCAWGFTAR